MPIPTTGPLNFTNLQAEFGGVEPIRMTEYYRLGPNVPVSGQVSLSNFRGSYDTFFTTLTANTLNLDLYAYLTSLGWNGFSKVELTIPTGIYVYSNSTSVPAISINNFPRQVTILNSGFIMGMGGDGGAVTRPTVSYNGQPGGPAIQMNSPVPLIIQNLATGYIGGGGGGGASSPWSGGGGGAGGGRGGSGHALGTNDSGAITPGGAGGGLGAVGANASGPLPGSGGGAGGGGGGYIEQKGADATGGGGGGGRIFPGDGGVGSEAGGRGGGQNSRGLPGGGAAPFERGGGGGGWGAFGGSNVTYSGGSGGKAINILNGTVSVAQGAARIYGVVS